MNASSYPVIGPPEKPIDQIQSEEDLVKALRMAIGEAEEAAASHISESNRNYQYIRGNQFIRKANNGDWITDTKNPYWRLRLRRDIINPVISTSLPVLHKLRPKMIVEADHPGEPVVAFINGQHIPLPIMGFTAASHLQRAVEAEWSRRQEEILQAELLLETMISGVAFRTYMPVMEAHNVVRIKPYLLSRSQFLGDPKGTDLATFSDFKFIIIEQWWDVADIERIYNIKEKSFAKGPGDDSYEPDDSGIYRRQYQFRDGDRMGIKQKHTTMTRRVYPVHTIFYNQGSPDVISYGKKPPKSLKYPLGREMVLINKTKLVGDRHNRYWHGRFPITAYQTMPMPHMQTGFSDVTPLVEIQNIVNILQNMIVTNAMALGVPQWLAEKGAVDTGDLTNEPGAIIEVQTGALGRGAVQRLDPGSIGTEIYTVLRDLQVYGMEDLGDVSDALQGKSLGSGASGVYANTLLGAALTKQGFRAQMLDAGHKRSAWLELMMMQQFLHVDEEYIRRNKDMGELLHMSLAMRELFFDVKVESQAELPHNPQSRINLAANLFSMGIFDLQEFLMFTGLNVRPDLEETLRRASEEFFMPAVPAETQAQIRTELELAKLRMQQAGGGMPPQGGGPGGQQSLPQNPANPPTNTGPAQNAGVSGDPSRTPVL